LMSNDAHHGKATTDQDGLKTELERRRAHVLAMGGEEKLAKRKAAGLLNARERLDLLFDADSLREVGMFGTSMVPGEEERTPADGKIAGFGRIENRPVAAVANDLTVKGASSATVNAKKIAYVKNAATRNGMPLVFLGESTGSRLPDTMGAGSMAVQGLDPQQYCRRRESPWASAILGPCLGSSTWYSTISDFTVMRKGAFLAVSSPLVTSKAIGEVVDPEELGGWRLHQDVTGLADAIVNTDEEAINFVRQFLSYMPSHSKELAPAKELLGNEAPDAAAIDAIVPTQSNKTYDMRKLVKQVVDRDSYFPIKEKFGRSAITALARLNGKSIGVIATNPMFKGGALDPDGCRKTTSFMVLCDSFNIPLVFLVDTPGFLVGLEGERKSAPAHIMNMIHALQMVSVPKLTVILRKSYGQAYLNLGGGRNSDAIAVWPGADISFMGPQVAANVLGIAEVKDHDTTAWQFAGAFGAQDVIAPQDTRNWLSNMLAFLGQHRTGGLGRHELANWPTYF
jgi:acetyl-CoA carboxylase carboxyltransferase component